MCLIRNICKKPCFGSSSFLTQNYNLLFRNMGDRIRSWTKAHNLWSLAGLSDWTQRLQICSTSYSELKHIYSKWKLLSRSGYYFTFSVSKEASPVLLPLHLFYNCTFPCKQMRHFCCISAPSQDLLLSHLIICAMDTFDSYISRGLMEWIHAYIALKIIAHILHFQRNIRWF